jgi:cytochrome b561
MCDNAITAHRKGPMDSLTVAQATRPATRYTPTAQALHWITAALIAAVVVIAWIMTSMARDNPIRGTYYQVHKALGITILALVALRLAWRALNRAPPPPDHLARWEHNLSTATHVLLYALMLIMPLSGYIGSAAGGQRLSFFFLFDIPSILPQDKSLSQNAYTVHVACRAALYVLVTLHVLATAWHVAIRRDGTLDRMLPAQDGR